MIIVRFTSGLGNQMFQYSFYRFLKTLYRDTQVKADLTWFYANNDHHGYELQRIFGAARNSSFDIEEAGKGEIFKVTGLVPNLMQPREMITAGEKQFDKASVLDSFKPEECLKHGHFSISGAQMFEGFRRYPNRIIREFTQKKREPYIIDQLTGKISNEDLPDGSNKLYDKVTHLDITKDWYIIGFWIEEKYLRGRLDEIKKHFRFPAITDERNSALAQEILSCNSVSIHVRRGDYLSDIYESMFATLGRDYYEGAVEHIKGQVENPEFFIFSDDVDFVRDEFKWLENKHIVTGNEGDDSFRDMQLMSLCRHNIIANSTFSQWGALLNENEGNITVYPRAYLKERDNEIKCFDGWVRI
ncbi:MAG: alpha-1,2-fucosyltransferase [Lachnospiraceae bacterium]|nr:alpha-1,2-fucosyltransferase [Lachnospiraceae bacterium]